MRLLTVGLFVWVDVIEGATTGLVNIVGFNNDKNAVNTGDVRSMRIRGKCVWLDENPLTGQYRLGIGAS